MAESIRVRRPVPSRPIRLGSPRRMRRAAKRSEPLPGADVARGGDALRASGADSLDTDKYLLKTTVRNWDKARSTPEEERIRVFALHERLVTSVNEVFLRHAHAAENAQDAETRAKEEKAAQRWQRKMIRLRDCQTLWMGYRATCCKGATRPIAVPVGCNDRLCPLCCWHRSERARKRIKSLFDRLEHPAMITLTIPNRQSIRKHDYTLFRQRVRKFIADSGEWLSRNEFDVCAEQREWIRGGVYSMETTYNRVEKTWHIHAHILLDLGKCLPKKGDKIEIAGRKIYRFTAIKQRLEYEWMRLWINDFGKRPRKNAPVSAFVADEGRWEEWMQTAHSMRLKEWRDGGYQPIEGLSAAELKARAEWNAKYRRVFDIRPVDNREGAAYEVLKYITKVSDMADCPDAIEPFCDAVKGARLIQTFGTWYGAKIEPEEPQDGSLSWAHLSCTCGENKWKRMGCFFRHNVEFDEDGRSYLKPPLDHNSAGTVPKPIIAALAVREE